MPRMDRPNVASQLCKLLLIGDGKSGKTRFAGEAADAGFNVLYLNGDVAAPTLAQLSDSAKQRIYLIDAVDTMMGGIRDTRFHDTVVELATSIKMRWNDTLGRIAKAKDEDEVWEVTPAKMGHHDILVLDSWTAMTESIMLKCAREHSVDLSNATTAQMRPVYQSSGLMATSLMQVIRSMPCHVIVLGHPDEYEHRVNPDGKKVRDINEKDMIIEWTKQLAKSTSKPHGLTMPKYFTDVAWLTVSPTGQRKLDFRPKEDRVGGGHFDGWKGTDEYSFANLIKAIGGTLPGPDNNPDHFLNIIPAGPREPKPNPVLEGGDTGAVKTTGIGGLFSGKK